MTTISIHQSGAGKLKKERRRLTTALTAVQPRAAIIAMAEARAQGDLSQSAGNGPMPALLFAGGHDV